jgi:hypothetical protein
MLPDGTQPAPSDINVHTILTAKVETLKWWISCANTAAMVCGEKKNPLMKTGNATELCRKLAGHYGIHLDVPVIPTLEKQKNKGKDEQALNVAIWVRQWTHMWTLGAKWKHRCAKKEPFVLCEQGV